jgi:hypothetical protein
MNLTPTSAPDDFARFAHKRVRCDGEPKRSSNDSINIRSQLCSAS